MLRMGLGLALIAWVVAVQAALPEEDFFASKLNLLTIHSPVHSGNDLPPSSQFSASVVLVRSPDSSPFGSVFSSNPQLLPIAKTQQEPAQALNSYWDHTVEDGRISLPRNLRIEFKVEQLNIAVHSNSVSLDEEHVKIVLHAHSASMLWRKTF
jgi:hypothetical protein